MVCTKPLSRRAQTNFGRYDELSSVCFVADTSTACVRIPLCAAATAGFNVPAVLS